MSRYHVGIERAPRRIAAIRDRRLRGEIEAAAFGDEPRPPGVKKLVGREELWRVRVEDWRGHLYNKAPPRQRCGVTGLIR